jgi:hypothetical protein
LLLPIEQVPLGARVPTKNPRPWEFDASLPEPDQATWAKLSLTMFRDDGGVVDAELIRPQAWIRQHGIEAGQLLPMHIEELQVRGSVLVNSIGPCPVIATGEGSVVTARFCTREVHEIVRVEIHGPSGEIETLEGTAIHPIWSIDRQDWVPLGELEAGEQLLGSDEVAIVLAVRHLRTAVPVYNIEVHGEHVYQVGELETLVHNSCAPIRGGLGYPGSMVNIYLGAKREAGLGKIIGWGVGARGAIARTANITKDELVTMGMTKDVATYWLKFYNNAKDLGRGAATAPERIKLMERILELLD